MDRLAWLAERQSGVTATDVRRLVCPWDPSRPEGARIFDEKAGPVADSGASPLMEMGLATEEHNARLYARRTGFALVTFPPLSRNPAEPWQVASLDRQAADGRPVELKYTPFFNDDWGEEYTDAIPLGYVVQVTWQMQVVGAEWADVSALNGYGDHRVYRVRFEPELAKALTVIAADFWAVVRAGLRPADDWAHPLAARLVEARERVEAGKRVRLPDAEFAAFEWLELKAVERRAAELADEVKAGLVARMGDAEEAEAGRYRLCRKPRARFVREVKSPKKARD